VPPRQGNQNSLLAPAGAFKVAGGRYITVAVLRDSHWQKFCVAAGLEQLANDARFATNAARVAHRAELHALIIPLFESQPAEFWLEKLRAADILCGPINTVADVLADPALKACLPLLDIGLPNVAQALGSPIRYNGEFFSAERAAPAKGQHTKEVLAEIGYRAEEIEGFLRDGSAFTEEG
jgi:crotonobetainyl-CoA:carnitine CoA-transferase CaiB-like acyl-CoA transferase